MKLLIATGIYPPEIGGPSTYLQKLIPLLNESGWETDVLTYGEPRAGVYTVRRKRFALFRMFLYAWHLWPLAKEADVLFTTDTFSAGFPTLIVSKLRRKPLVLRFSGIFAYEEETKRKELSRSMTEFLHGKKHGIIKFISIVERFILKRVNHIIATSPFLANYCLQQDVNKANLSTILTAPVIDQLPTKKTLREQLHISPSTICLLSASRLIPHKAVDTLIRTLTILPNQYHLRIIGEGSEEDKLKLLAKNLNVLNRTTFLGKLDQKETQKNIKAADAYLLNSTYEGLSNTALEAIALGTPVFLSKVEGNTDLVTDGKTGYLFTQGNFQELAQKLQKIHTPATARVTLAAQQSINTWDNVFTRTKKILETVAKKSDNEATP